MPPALSCGLVLLLDGDDVPFNETSDFNMGEFPTHHLIFDVAGQILPLDTVLRVVLIQ